MWARCFSLTKKTPRRLQDNQLHGRELSAFAEGCMAVLNHNEGGSSPENLRRLSLDLRNNADLMDRQRGGLQARFSLGASGRVSQTVPRPQSLIGCLVGNLDSLTVWFPALHRPFSRLVPHALRCFTDTASSHMFRIRVLSLDLTYAGSHGHRDIASLGPGLRRMVGLQHVDLRLCGNRFTPSSLESLLSPFWTRLLESLRLDLRWCNRGHPMRVYFLVAQKQK